MNEFSSEEMRRLQDEAKKRVLDMKTRSRFLTEDINRDFFRDNTDESKLIKPNRKAKAIKMPVEFPEQRKIDRSSENSGKMSESEGQRRAENIEKRKPEKTSAMFDDFFADLSDDDLERLFILSLCLLLSHEQTDGEVLLALMYILS